MAADKSGNESLAKNFEFKLIEDWLGYNSANDKTNLAENVAVQGSQNMYKKLSGNWSVRPGQKRKGAANPTFSPVSSEFVWNTSWGATYPLVISNNNLYVIIDDIWYSLLAGLTSTRYIFDKWWDNTEKKDRVLFVHGNSDIQHWSGGMATVLSSTVNTITKNGSTSWQQAGFASNAAGEKKIMISGVEYTYTGGESTTILTGVTPDPSGIVPGSIALQSVITTLNTPAAGFNNDFIKVINNQVYVGSYTSRLCYISSNTNFADYVVPTPRTPGSPELLTLDSTLNGIGVRQGKAHISIGVGEWAVITFTDITVGTTLIQKTDVDIKPVANLAAAYAHEFIANVGDNLVYLAKDKQVRTFGDFNDSFVSAYPSLSQEISTELSAESFIGGGLKCIADFTYLTAPVSGKTYLYQVRQTVNENNQVFVERLWHTPFIWNATHIDEINGVIVAFSNANPQIYEVWDTNQWHDDSPSDEPLPYSCVLALSYRTGGRRQGLQSFDKLFTEGYLTRGTLLNVLMNYDYQGSTNQIIQPVNGLKRPAKLFTLTVGSLGDTSLGDNPLGDEMGDETTSQDLAKFKNINSLAIINCFEYQPVYYSDTVDAQWEILAVGTNAHIEAEQDATFLINKLRTQTIPTPAVGSFILQEDGFYILQEDGSLIKL